MTLEKLTQSVTTLELGSYFIEFVKIQDFKKYYYDNINSFSKISSDSFLKALDIPPKFFKENPEETQKELLDNREIFVRERKKYANKVIVVAKVKRDNSIINCSRLSEDEAIKNYNRLKPIDEVSDKFEHRSFIKDSYITYVISDKLENKKQNKVIVIDFPITLNKATIIHKATYTLPDETFATPVEHIQYLESIEVDFELENKDIKEAVEKVLPYLKEERKVEEAKEILREPDVVALALQQAGVIPHSYIEKVSSYIKENTKGTLTTAKLESLVLDYDENFRGYKQVTAIREINGHAILAILDSPTFKEFIDEMENIADDLDEAI